MNNEPVAYINVEERKLEWAKPTAWETPTIAKIDKIPLYTNPVKELTDEEINELYMEHGNKDWDCQIDFAKAILKKAQEVLDAFSKQMFCDTRKVKNDIPSS